MPVPAAVFCIGLVAMDLTSFNKRDGVSHTAHLSGALFGLASFVLLRGRARSRIGF
jgi:membrane associated rhomboid family serine protease